MKTTTNTLENKEKIDAENKVRAVFQNYQIFEENQK